MNSFANRAHTRENADDDGNEDENEQHTYHIGAVLDKLSNDDHGINRTARIRNGHGIKRVGVYYAV